jgi:hypothetical protein
MLINTPNTADREIDHCVGDRIRVERRAIRTAQQFVPICTVVPLHDT